MHFLENQVYIFLCGETAVDQAGLADSTQQEGRYQVIWRGTTIQGVELPSGIYFARLVTPEYSNSIKMLLLK